MAFWWKKFYCHIVMSVHALPIPCPNPEATVLPLFFLLLLRSHRCLDEDLTLLVGGEEKEKEGEEKVLR